MNRRDAFKAFGFFAALASLGSTSKETINLRYRLGKQPARPHYGLKLRDYITPRALPTPPENFGHENLVADWDMLGNGPDPSNPPYAPNGAGDCAIAGPFHAEMLWCAMGKKPVNVNTACTLAEYSAITGYDPNAYDPFTQTNPTDKGSDVQDVAEYWRTHGLKDADGNVHKIDCYLALEPGNVEQLYHAMYLFNAVGIGIECPAEYQQAFANGQVWDAITDPTIEGGHYILGVGRRAGHINTITWGRSQLMTAAGYQQFCDEAFVYLSEEMLISGKDIDGFNLDQLIADMAELANDSTVYDPPTQPIPVCEEFGLPDAA